jgi:hypothetical protein
MVKKKEKKPVVCCMTLYFGTTTVAFIGADFEADFWDNKGPILGQTCADIRPIYGPIWGKL